MSFYLHIEVDSPLSPTEFSERVVAPIREALEKEGLGHVIDGDAEDDVPGEKYELSLQVTDQQRAKNVVEAVLKSVNG
jgi:hypothetical protein